MQLGHRSIWVALFLLQPRNQRAMLWTGLIFAPAGPINEFWSLKDYWHPIYLITIREWRFGIEDYIVTFALAGISAGVFEGLVLRRGFTELPPVSVKTILRMWGFGAVGLCLLALFASGFRFNSIHALLLSVMITSIILLFGRWKILLLILPVAAIYGFLYWVFSFVLLPLRR